MLARACFVGLLAALPLVMGCGLFGGEEEFELMVFEEDVKNGQRSGGVSGTPVPELGVDREVLVEVSFLYGHQVRLERLQRVIRDLTGLTEYENRGEVDLEWVVEVHEVTREAEEFMEG